MHEVSRIDAPQTASKSLNALPVIVANGHDKSTSRRGIDGEQCPRGQTLRRSVAWSLATSFVALWLGVAPVSHAEEPPIALNVAVRLTADLATLDGQVEVTLTNVTATALDRVPLWTFPERLATPPSGMPEVEGPNMFPRGFDPGAMRLIGVSTRQHSELHIERRSREVTEVVLKEPLPPGESVTLRVRFETRVPRRYGPFGRVGDQLMLDGGAVPRPPPLDEDGFHVAAPPDRVRWSLALDWLGGEPAELVVNGQSLTMSQAAESSVLSGVADRISMSVIVGARVSRFEHEGTRYRLFHRRTRCHEASDGALVDFGCVDAQGQVLASMANSMSWLMGRAKLPPQREVTLVEAPLRRDVAFAAPGMVWISDRAFEVLPIERAHKFHRVALSRALFVLVLEDQLRITSWRERAQIIDMVAVALAQNWEIFQYGKRESGMDVLDEGSFVAAIDDTMAAPQVPFISTYFVATDDTDRYRDRLSLFSHRRPTGRLWLAKLRDRLGHQAVERVVWRLLEGDVDLKGALSEVSSEDMMAYLARWIDGPPAVNYRLGRVTPGADDGGDFVDIEVHRDGGSEGFSEIVTVRVGEGRARVDHTFEMREPRQDVRVRVPASVPEPRVELDPGGRLIERTEESQRDARRDNRNFSRWRYRLDGVYGTINSASGHLDLRLITSLKALQEPQHFVTLVASNVERSLGVGGSYLHGFGALILPNLHRFHVGGGLGASWLKATDSDPDGLVLRASASVSEITFESATDPRDGYSWALSGGPSMLYQSDEVIMSAFVEARATGVLEVSPSHVLAGHLRCTSLFGDLPTSQNLPIGGIGVVRAFGTYARTGRHRVLARAEWRHRLTGDFSWNVLRLFWVRAIDGVAFVDAALLADSPGDFGDAASVYLGAGYGLRFHYLVGGVYPMVFLFDVALPVLDGGHLGATSGPGFSMVVGVGQAF
jgi:hypothetical protein